jgi:subtilisin family serine protease
MHHMFTVSHSVSVTQAAPRVDRIAQLRWFLVAALAAVVVWGGAGPAWGQASAAAAFAPKIATGQILVGKADKSLRADFDAELKAQGGYSAGTLANVDVDIVRVPAGSERDVVAKLKGSKHVRFAEVDQLMPAAATVNDPSYPNEWHLPQISAPTAWNYTMGSGVTIAILDTGVDGTHPDLAPNMVAGYNFYDGNTNTADVNGHGTAVAGAAAAAANNGIGVAGVAGAAKIMPLRVADPSAYAMWSTTAQAINYAADHGARIVNLSYQGAAASSTIQSAASYLRSKGGVLFVAAGNTGALDSTTPTNLMEVVSATDTGDTFATFSTYGPFVTISAPGNNILTTAMGGGYQYWWGTSLATPVAAGTAALIVAKRPDFTAAQIDSTLQQSATDLGAAGRDNYFGFGRVNAGAAVTLAANGVPSDTTPPSVSIASPTGGSVTGTTTVTVNASDNVGVARVELRVNGSLLGTDTTAPYTFSWNTTALSNGSATLVAAAYDAAGNSASSASVTVNVSNAPPPDTTPPTVAITAPASGATVTGQSTITASASDNVGVTRVDFMINGSTVATMNAAPYQYGWATTQYTNGPVSLTATAYDAAGNNTTSAAVSVNVNNPPPQGTGGPTVPVVTITSPTSGAMVVVGTVTIAATATENGSASGIQQTLYIDGAKKTTTTAGRALSYAWNTKKVASGTHTILVTAKDAAGNTSSSQIQVTRK